MASVKIKNHKFLNYGITVMIKRIHGNTITVVPSDEEKAYFVDANALHNSFMPYL